MKVLYLAANTLLGLHFKAGWENAFNALGHTFVYVDPFQENIGYRLRSEQFDLIMASSGDNLLDLPIDTLNANNTALVVNGLPYNDYCISPDIQAPCASSIEVRHLANLNRKLVWSQWSDVYVDYFFSGYRSLGIPAVSLPYAADITQAPDAVRGVDDILYKIVFVGNLRHRKRGNIELIRKLLSLVPREQILIHGGDDWQRLLKVEARQPVAANQLSRLYGTSLISPNIHTVRQKSHQLQVNDRCFQIPASGGFQVCDNPLALGYFEDSEIVVANTGDEFIERVDYFLRHPEATLPYVKAALSAVKAKHSYFNRIATLFGELSFNDPVALNGNVWKHYDISNNLNDQSIDLDKLIYYAMESGFMRTGRMAKRMVSSINR